MEVNKYVDQHKSDKSKFGDRRWLSSFFFSGTGWTTILKVKSANIGIKMGVLNKLRCKYLWYRFYVCKNNFSYWE